MRAAARPGSAAAPRRRLAPPDPKQPARPRFRYAVGDDVVHASFGEGVVTAVEAGSVVVVRFAGDGGRAQADGRLRTAEEGRLSATVIDGKAVAAEVRERVAAGVAEFAAAHDGRVPGLATVLVGDDPASQVYVANKRRQTEEVGMRSIHHELDAETSQDELLDLVSDLNADDEVDGILVQLPLPDALDQDRGHRDDRPGQGRRRAHRGERRPARAGPAGPRPVHAAGRGRAASARGNADRGRRGGRPRPLDPRRPAARGAAVERERDRDRLSLAHRRPGRGVLARRHPRRRGRRRTAGRRRAW